MPLSWLTHFSRLQWSLGKSPGVCPWKRQHSLYGWEVIGQKCQRGWVMEFRDYTVISLRLSSPQIYRRLISASPTLMEIQAFSFQISAICALSFPCTYCTYTAGWNLSHFGYLYFFSHALWGSWNKCETGVANQVKSKKVKATNLKLKSGWIYWP